MRDPRSALGLTLAALFGLLLGACSDDDTPTGPGGELPVRDSVLSRTWNDGTLSAMAYDRLSDHLFLLQDVHGGENVIHRWDFVREELSEVHRYTSQHDYGMRVIGGDLWIARTYDEAFRRLSDLSADELTLVGDYEFGGAASPATEVGDLAPLDGDVLFVTSNPLTSDQHDGIQALEGPDYQSIREVLGESQANWETLTAAAYRSIVVLGQGSLVRLAVTTGASDGALVVYDRSGNEQFRAEEFGRSHLQADSQGRLYAVAARDTIVRWSPDFATREEFAFDLPSVGVRFVLRETGGNVEFLYGPFRSGDFEIGRIRLPR